MSLFFAPVVNGRAPSRQSFDRSFERFLNESFFSDRRSVAGVAEDDKAWTISLDVPGVSREELAINIEGPIVRIETSAQAQRQYKAAYETPQDIDADASSAKLENGVLTLTLVKKVPVSNARTIAIK